MPAQSEARKLIYGVDTAGSLADVIRESGSTNPMLVSSAHYSLTSFYMKLKDRLGEGHSEFREVTGGPPLPEVEHLAEAYRNKGCDHIVSVGDSSVIWASKLLKYYYAHEAKHTVIPTTLTVSSFSDWAEYRLGDEAFQVSDASIVPDTVILDPVASLETEPRTWYSSGLGIMDYTFSNLMRPDISAESEDLLSSSLESLIVNLPGKSMESRMECFLSSWYSKEDGYSIEEDPMNSIRRSMKSATDLPEDLISAIVLPLSVYRCMKEKPESLASIASRLGFRGDDTTELSNKSLELVQGLIRKLGVGDTLAEFGFGAAQIREVLSKLPLEKNVVDRIISPIFTDY